MASRLVRGIHDGVHAADQGERAHAEFELGDDVEHGRRPVGIAAVVGGKPVEELRRWGWPVRAFHVLSRWARGRDRHARRARPRWRAVRMGVSSRLRAGLLQKQAPCSVEPFSAQVEMVQHGVRRNVQSLLDFGLEPVGRSTRWGGSRPPK